MTKICKRKSKDNSKCTSISVGICISMLCVMLSSIGALAEPQNNPRTSLTPDLKILLASAKILGDLLPRSAPFIPNEDLLFLRKKFSHFESLPFHVIFKNENEFLVDVENTLISYKLDGLDHEGQLILYINQHRIMFDPSESIEKLWGVVASAFPKTAHLWPTLIPKAEAQVPQAAALTVVVVAGYFVSHEIGCNQYDDWIQKCKDANNATDGDQIIAKAAEYYKIRGKNRWSCGKNRSEGLYNCVQNYYKNYAREIPSDQAKFFDVPANVSNSPMRQRSPRATVPQAVPQSASSPLHQ